MCLCQCNINTAGGNKTAQDKCIFEGTLGIDMEAGTVKLSNVLIPIVLSLTTAVPVGTISIFTTFITIFYFQLLS